MESSAPANAGQRGHLLFERIYLLPGEGVSVYVFTLPQRPLHGWFSHTALSNLRTQHSSPLGYCSAATSFFLDHTSSKSKPKEKPFASLTFSFDASTTNETQETDAKFILPSLPDTNTPILFDVDFSSGDPREWVLRDASFTPSDDMSKFNCGTLRGIDIEVDKQQVFSLDIFDNWRNALSNFQEARQSTSLLPDQPVDCMLNVPVWINFDVFAVWPSDESDVKREGCGWQELPKETLFRFDSAECKFNGMAIKFLTGINENFVNYKITGCIVASNFMYRRVGMDAQSVQEAKLFFSSSCAKWIEEKGNIFVVGASMAASYRLAS